MYMVLRDFHSLGIGTFCMELGFFYDSCLYLRVLLQLLKSMFFSSMVYIFPALSAQFLWPVFGVNFSIFMVDTVK